ncbi:MAG: hypothetical protein HPY78_05335 [Brevinematales bacterium]|nr:hypothetical protein [Brevinematales bacterium]
MKIQKMFFFFLVMASVVGCYNIDRVRPNNIQKYLEKYPERGIIYLTYSYYNPEGNYIDALGIYRFLWNYKQPQETYYLLEMENTKSNEMVVYYTAPTVINPVDFIISNTTFNTTMVRHTFPEQPIYVQTGEIVYLGHIYIHITNTKVGFIPTTAYKFFWEDREATDKEAFFKSFPQLSNWVWRKQLVEVYVKPKTVLPQPSTQPTPQPTSPTPQVIYVTNVIVVTNTTNQ